MPEKFKVHLVAATAALYYATHEIEADNAEAAKEAVIAGLGDGSINPTWNTAQSPITVKDHDESAYIHGVESEEPPVDEASGANQMRADHDPSRVDAQRATGDTSAGGPTIPSNRPIGGANRLQRDMDPKQPTSELPAGNVVVKSRPGAVPLPVAGSADDPTKSPTPAADGVTHLPAGQRSQAVAAPGRTLNHGSVMENAGSKPRALARDERDTAEVHPSPEAPAGGATEPAGDVTAEHDHQTSAGGSAKPAGE